MYKRHLVIAPYLLENSEIMEFYRLLITKGADVILDNGVYETGEAMNLDNYIKVIKKLEPTQVVAPDAWGDFQKTILLVDEFCQRVEDEGLESKFQVMGVPHGKTIEEYLKCYYDIIPMVDVIGISVGEWDDHTGEIRRFFVKNMDSRFDHTPIHLLGLWNAHELERYSQLPRVRSVDTSMPFKIAKRNRSLKYGCSGVSYESSDFTKMNFHDEWTEEQLHLAKDNVEELKKWVEEHV